LLRVEDLSKSWKNFRIERLSFEVQNREHFIILGPSGAGKTLLLETIAGIFKPESGKILLEGKDITSLPPEKRNIAYIPQNYGLFPHLNAFENIAYGLRLRRLPKEDIQREVHAIADTLEISHLLKRNVKTLSGGEQQRVAIARALVLKPKLILLDEPFSSVDPNMRAKLMREMKKWRREIGFTAIHVTHSFEEALFLGNRVGIMINGKLEQVGEIEYVFSKPKNEIVARLLGLENILEGEADGYMVEVDGQRIEIPMPAKGRIRIVIPPEGILISKERVISSARNSFKATIQSFEDLGAIMKIRLKVGRLNLFAYLTKASFLDMRLSEGEEIFISFKATSVHVFD
jgi:molybdate/tungstate transport system ATP-binding protein